MRKMYILKHWEGRHVRQMLILRTGEGCQVHKMCILTTNDHCLVSLRLHLSDTPADILPCQQNKVTTTDSTT